MQDTRRIVKYVSVGNWHQIDGDIFADGGRCIVCGTGMYITSEEGTEGGLYRRNVILAYLLRLY